jgi:hypothetical protein
LRDKETRSLVISLSLCLSVHILLKAPHTFPPDRSGDDEFKRGFTKFEFVAANKGVRSTLRQADGAVDESAVGAAQIFNKKLVALI